MVSGLRRELRTELLWPSVAAHKQHHAAGNLQGQGVAMVFLHHRQRKIGARRNAGAGPDIAILGEDPVTIHRNARMTLGQHVRQFPVRGGSAVHRGFRLRPERKLQRIPTRCGAHALARVRSQASNSGSKRD